VWACASGAVDYAEAAARADACDRALAERVACAETGPALPAGLALTGLGRDDVDELAAAWEGRA